jgi:hypothetical protein
VYSTILRVSSIFWCDYGVMVALDIVSVSA